MPACHSGSRGSSPVPSLIRLSPPSVAAHMRIRAESLRSALPKFSRLVERLTSTQAPSWILHCWVDFRFLGEGNFLRFPRWFKMRIGVSLGGLLALSGPGFGRVANCSTWNNLGRMGRLWKTLLQVALFCLGCGCVELCLFVPCCSEWGFLALSGKVCADFAGGAVYWANWTRNVMRRIFNVDWRIG
jgi:hypothetical protein